MHRPEPYRVVVPVPVSGGTGSVTISSNGTTEHAWNYLNGVCIQVGIIPPSGTPNGVFYCMDPVGFVPISGNFTNGAFNFNGYAGLVGDITVNIVSATVDGTYAIVFIMLE